MPNQKLENLRQKRVSKMEAVQICIDRVAIRSRPSITSVVAPETSHCCLRAVEIAAEVLRNVPDFSIQQLKNITQFAPAPKVASIFNF